MQRKTDTKMNKEGKKGKMTEDELKRQRMTAQGRKLAHFHFDLVLQSMSPLNKVSAAIMPKCDRTTQC